MKKNWFNENFTRFSLLKAKSIEWVNTQYQHGGNEKNISIDCVHFVEKFCLEIGIITSLFPSENYPIDWYLKGEEKILTRIDQYMAEKLNPLIEFEKINPPIQFYPGDLLCFQIKSPVVNHVGIKLDKNFFIHANTKSRKVVIESVESYRKNIKKVYQFWEKE